MRSTLRLLVVLAAVAIPGVTAVHAQDASPTSAVSISTATVVPPDEDPLGVPYGEWAGRWWAWVIGQPVETNPLVTGDCEAGQGGEVFFIPHSSPGVEAETECRVSADQWILASGGGTYWDTTGGCAGTETEGDTEAELRACIEADRPVFSNVSISVDGEVLPDIDAFWVVSPMFDIEIPEGNIFDIPPQSAQALVGGWFVMLEPLSPGSHTIVVQDDIDIPDDEEGPLTAQLTAHLEVTDAAASPGTSPAATEAGAVTIRDFAFQPESLEVAVGTAVAWTNEDAAPHTATADDGSFDSGVLEQGATFSHTFEEAGTFSYTCAIHPNMTGTIRVG